LVKVDAGGPSLRGRLLSEAQHTKISAGCMLGRRIGPSIGRGINKGPARTTGRTVEPDRYGEACARSSQALRIIAECIIDDMSTGQHEFFGDQDTGPG
jgi:hypothetical protein